jgi:hypothetical protein
VTEVVILQKVVLIVAFLVDGLTLHFNMLLEAEELTLRLIILIALVEELMKNRASHV